MIKFHTYQCSKHIANYRSTPIISLLADIIHLNSTNTRFSMYFRLKILQFKLGVGNFGNIEITPNRWSFHRYFCCLHLFCLWEFATLIGDCTIRAHSVDTGKLGISFSSSITSLNWLTSYSIMLILLNYSRLHHQHLLRWNPSLITHGVRTLVIMRPESFVFLIFFYLYFFFINIYFNVSDHCMSKEVLSRVK